MQNYVWFYKIKNNTKFWKVYYESHNDDGFGKL